MAPLLDIPRRSSKSKDEEVSKPLFRSIQILRRVHRAKDIVTGNLPVKGSHQPLKSILADLFENTIFRKLFGHPSIFSQ
jgi:hypothetical protein